VISLLHVLEVGTLDDVIRVSDTQNRYNKVNREKTGRGSSQTKMLMDTGKKGSGSAKTELLAIMLLFVARSSQNFSKW